MYGLGSKRSIIREIFEYCKSRAQVIGADNVFDFSIGNPSVEPPIEIKNAISELISSDSALTLHSYTSAQGDAGVRGAIASDIKSRFGVDITGDDIYMTCGAAASLTITLKALLLEGEECIVFAPFFTEYRVFIENAGGKVVISNPMAKSFQIDLVDFESKITPNTKAIILNSPNNPSGVVYTEDTVRGVCEILNKKQMEYGHDIFLIADEPYRELVYGDISVPYLMNYYDNTVVCYSYSKSLSLPGERIGYIAVSPKMKLNRDVYFAVCGAGRSLGYVCAPSMFQQVIKKTVGVKVDVSVYKENRDILYDALSEYGYECVKPDGAFYLFVKALEEDAIEFYKKAKSKEILLVPCDDFGVKGYVRIAYCVPKERIVKALPYFKELIDEYR